MSNFPHIPGSSKNVSGWGHFQTILFFYIPEDHFFTGGWAFYLHWITIARNTYWALHADTVSIKPGNTIARNCIPMFNVYCLFHYNHSISIRTYTIMVISDCKILTGNISIRVLYCTVLYWYRYFIFLYTNISVSIPTLLILRYLYTLSRVSLT